jgi:hypothetical protein
LAASDSPFSTYFIGACIGILLRDKDNLGNVRGSRLKIDRDSSGRAKNSARLALGGRGWRGGMG